MIDYNKITNFNKLKNHLKLKSEQIGSDYNHIVTNYIAQCLMDRLSKTSWSNSNKVIGGAKFALMFRIDVRTSKDVDIDIYEVRGDIDQTIIKLTEEINEVEKSKFDFIKKFELKESWMDEQKHSKSEKVGKSVIYTVYIGDDNARFDFKMDIALYDKPFINTDTVIVNSNLLEADVSVSGIPLIDDFFNKLSIVIESIFEKKRYKDVYDVNHMFGILGLIKIISNKDRLYNYVDQNAIDDFVKLYNNIKELDPNFDDFANEYNNMKKLPYLKSFNLIDSLTSIYNFVKDNYINKNKDFVCPYFYYLFFKNWVSEPVFSQ